MAMKFVTPEILAQLQDFDLTMSYPQRGDYFNVLHVTGCRDVAREENKVYGVPSQHMGTNLDLGPDDYCHMADCVSKLL